MSEAFRLLESAESAANVKRARGDWSAYPDNRPPWDFMEKLVEQHLCNGPMPSFPRHLLRSPVSYARATAFGAGAGAESAAVSPRPFAARPFGRASTHLSALELAAREGLTDADVAQLVADFIKSKKQREAEQREKEEQERLSKLMKTQELMINSLEKKMRKSMKAMLKARAKDDSDSDDSDGEGDEDEDGADVETEESEQKQTKKTSRKRKSKRGSKGKQKKKSKRKQRQQEKSSVGVASDKDKTKDKDAEKGKEKVVAESDGEQKAKEKAKAKSESENDVKAKAKAESEDKVKAKVESESEEKPKVKREREEKSKEKLIAEAQQLAVKIEELESKYPPRSGAIALGLALGQHGITVSKKRSDNIQALAEFLLFKQG